MSGTSHRSRGDGSPPSPVSRKVRKVEEVPEVGTPRAASPAPTLAASAATATATAAAAAATGDAPAVSKGTETIGETIAVDGNGARHGAGGSAGRDDGVARTRNPLVHNHDVLRHVKLFASKDTGYLFFAGVSRQWRMAWAETPSPAAPELGNNDTTDSGSIAQNIAGENKTPLKAAVQSVARVSWAKDCGCPWSEMTAMLAATAGNLEVLQWGRARELPWDKKVCAAAAVGGHLDVLRWLKMNGCPWDEAVSVVCRERTRA